MLLIRLSILPIVLVTLQISQTLAVMNITPNPNECGPLASVLACVGNQTVQVVLSPDDMTCQVNKASSPKFRDDYTLTPGIGWHKFHNQAKTWNEARKVCMEEDAQLAILNSKAEEDLLRNIFKQQLNNIVGAKTKDEVFLGAHDEFQEGDWVTVSGEPLTSTGYVNWSTDKKCYGSQPDGGRVQNCAALILKCEGMSDTWCSMPLAFFCDKPDICS